MQDFNGNAFLEKLIKHRHLQQSINYEDTSSFDVLRLDSLDSIISGNKAFKLIGHIQAFYNSEYRQLVSFGGVYSNHLHALAALCHKLTIPCIAYVRGYPDVALTPTLQDLFDWGVEIRFLNKQDYKKRNNPSFMAELSNQHQAYVIPEGGGGEAGLQGGKLLAKLCRAYQHIWLAAGTGTTALSLAKHLPMNTTLNIVNVVADNGALENKLTQHLPESINWKLFNTQNIVELGHFGKCSPALIDFIKHWDKQGLPLDPVYTAKLLWIYLQQEKLESNTLIIHSGGLQGRRGLNL